MKRIWLIRKRKEKGLKQIELAKMCGCSNRMISSIELGTRTPSGDLGCRIADVLDFDVRLLYREEKSA